MQKNKFIKTHKVTKQNSLESQHGKYNLNGMDYNWR